MPGLLPKKPLSTAQTPTATIIKHTSCKYKLDLLMNQQPYSIVASNATFNGKRDNKSFICILICSVNHL